MRTNPDCDYPEAPCQRTRVPIEAIQLGWDGPAIGNKAVSFPGYNHIYLETDAWDAVPTVEGRRTILAHERGHLEGAQCEPCADFFAGQILREEGMTTPRDGRRALLAGLDHRDSYRAQSNFARGFAADAPDGALLDFTDAPLQVSATTYGIFPLLLIVAAFLEVI